MAWRSPAERPLRYGPDVLAPILFALTVSAPAGAAVDAENPRSPEAARADETAASSGARPQGSPTPQVSPSERVRRTAIYYEGGFATPVGVAGLEVVRRIGQRFELAGGVGVGFAAIGSEPHAGPGHALQWTAMPRLRLGDDHGAFIAGAGISGGNYGNIPLCFEDPCPQTYPVSYFLWSNFELGGEWWWSGGFAMRLFAGYAHGWCVSDSCVNPLTNLPYFGWAFGYAF
jgi:hypothetical protein